MIETTTRRLVTVVTVISVLIVVESVTFLLAALLHTGIQFPLGISQPQIIPATIVEGLCRLLLGVSAYAVFVHKTWAWRVAVAAHAFAVVGVLLGISVTIRNPGGDEANSIYHWTILMVLVVVLALLTTRGARAGLGSGR
jgi:hypothetical protein